MSVATRVRATARHAALDVLSLSEALTGRLTRSTRRPRVHFLYLHSVPSSEQQRFAAMIDELAQSHTFLSHSEAIRRIQGGPIDAPYLSISFDDGFASNAAVGRMLADRGIQACFFITTGFIGTDNLEDARRFFGGRVGVDETAMTWRDVEGLAAIGHEIGNHTKSHPNMSQLSSVEVEEEVGGAAYVIEQRLGARPVHFAWPYGLIRHASSVVPTVAFATGHVSCTSAVRGAHVATAASTGTHRPFLRRDHIMTSWPLRHCRYFISQSARRAGPDSNDWPADWALEL